MAQHNLPWIKEQRLDGNLAVSSFSGNPRVLVIGTAENGASEELYNVARLMSADTYFHRNGTLIRGMYEANNAGANNVSLMRIGASSARVTNIGDPAATANIETTGKDGDMGSRYSMFYDATAGRLQVRRVADDVMVFDNNPAAPLDAVDLGDVFLTGTLGAANDIGTSSAFVLMENVVAPGGVYVAGDDGLSLSRMAIYESLFDAYELLDNAQVDLVVPMDVYLDDANITDLTAAEIATLGLSGMSAYPTMGSAGDVLGKLHVERYEDVNYFWWWMPADATQVADSDFKLAGNITAVADNGSGDAEFTSTAHGLSDGDTVVLTGFTTAAYNGTFTVANSTANTFETGALYGGSTDTGEFVRGGANLFPSEGLADAAHSIDGTLLTSSDFHEVNFAYQLANFCYTQGVNNMDMEGFIGVKPPKSFGVRGISNWIGSEPTYQLNTNNVLVVSENGKGLLGNKFMAGRVTNGSLPGLPINSIDGAAYGGFIATESGWLDGAALTDDNNHLIDIGQYMAMVQAWPTMTSPTSTSPYRATAAAIYAGVISAIPPQSSALNKAVPGVSLTYRINRTKLDALAGMRYTPFHSKTSGVVVTDAPTAARPDSDYLRLSTVMQVKETVDRVRAGGESYIGQGLSDDLMASLDTSIDRVGSELKKTGVIKRLEYRVYSTPQMRVLGQALVELKIVPAFELRQITVVVALAAA